MNAEEFWNSPEGERLILLVQNRDEDAFSLFLPELPDESAVVEAFLKVARKEPEYHGMDSHCETYTLDCPAQLGALNSLIAWKSIREPRRGKPVRASGFLII